MAQFNQIVFDVGIPTTSTQTPIQEYSIDDVIIFNGTPASGTPWGWTCTLGGYPGTWAPITMPQTVATGLTAHAGGGQTSALALTATINNVTTVATAANSVALPASAAGVSIVVINSGANAMQVFGSGTDTIGGVATGTGISQPPNSVYVYTCAVAGNWLIQATGSATGTPIQYQSFVTGLTALAGGGQTGATALTASYNVVSTVATAGNSVALPASVPGLVVTVLNRGANVMQVFGAGTDTINGIATATGISQSIDTTATYVCTTAGNWQVPIAQLTSSNPIALTTNGAILPHVQATYVITKAGVLADTLAAPTATTDDGIIITIFSNTANAHTITATTLYNTGGAGVPYTTATYAAHAGAFMTLMAYQGLWQVLASSNVTFS